jgi:predicted kinase
MDERMDKSMTVKKQAFIMVGVSGSGKSSIVAGLKKASITAGMDVRVFSLDTCRIDFFSKAIEDSSFTFADAKNAYAQAFHYCNDNDKEFKVFVADAFEFAKDADVLIIDNTNLSRKSRARWIEGARQKKMFVTGIQVDTPLQVVLDRQSTRGDKSVPAERVREMYMSQQQLLHGLEVDRVINISGMETFSDFESLI